MRTMLQWTLAERAIYEAQQLVEQMGADILLTEAGTRLSEARALVAQYIEAQPAYEVREGPSPETI